MGDETVIVVGGIHERSLALILCEPFACRRIYSFLWYEVELVGAVSCMRWEHKTVLGRFVRTADFGSINKFILLSW